MDVRIVRSRKDTLDAAMLMRGLVDANRTLYSDDLETIEAYYRGSWFLDDEPVVPPDYCPPQGDVLVAYLKNEAAGTVAFCRMDNDHCELKSMFVSPDFRMNGVAVALCEAVVNLARVRGYRFVRLTTGARQIAARRLYQKLGFELISPWDSDPPEGYDYFELDVYQV